MGVRAIRQFEARGLIYSAGRSAANYRLYDASALWCIGVIQVLRSLGLTIREIETLGVVYQEEPDAQIGDMLAHLLDAAELRITRRIDELNEVRTRIAAFRLEHVAALTGGQSADLVSGDPHRDQAP